jgi:hypothetical protein
MALFILQYRSPGEPKWVTCWAEIKYHRATEAREAFVRIGRRMQVPPGSQFRIRGSNDFVYYFVSGDMRCPLPNTTSPTYPPRYDPQISI